MIKYIAKLSSPKCTMVTQSKRQFFTVSVYVCGLVSCISAYKVIGKYICQFSSTETEHFDIFSLHLVTA